MGGNGATQIGEKGKIAQTVMELSAICQALPDGWICFANNPKGSCPLLAL